MATIESPQSFVTREQCDNATFHNGFQRCQGEDGGWCRYTSTTATGAVWLATDVTGAWWLATDHAGAVAELGIRATDFEGPGLERFRFQTLSELHEAVGRVYQLAMSLPDAPLREFQLKTWNMPVTTEAERLAVQRVGQDIFRTSLLVYWRGGCPMTGISDAALLRASHIKPWKDASNEERFDVHNGLLLSALWDASFDRGLVTFDDDGRPRYSSRLGAKSLEALSGDAVLNLNDAHRAFLEWHRAKVFKDNVSGGGDSGSE